MIRPLLLASIAIAATVSVRAQDVPDRPPLVAEEDLVVGSFRPHARAPGDLLDLARTLHGRRFVVLGPGRPQEAVDNLHLLDDTILVYETKDRAPALLQALADLDAASGGADPAVETTLYVPRHTSSAILLEALSPFQRELRIPLGDGSFGKVPSVSATQGLLLLRGSADSIQAMQKVLAQIDVEPAVADDAVRTLVYLPKHVGVQNLIQALAPLRRTVTLVHADGSIQAFENVAVPEGTGRLVLRDHPEALAHLVGMLTAFDVARPEVLLSCYVVQRLEGPPVADGIAITPELQKELDIIHPGGSFHILGLGGVMLTAGVETPVSIEMDLETFGTCELDLSPGPFDTETRVLTIERCQFMHRQVEVQSFTTRAALHADHYIPLGAIGDDPLYVFIRIRVME